ncbi:beta-N-acetylhexosaminidase [Akkermansiaceae bacterium]|nr:beta-N-acetylhexosaminidase [Akkermansiaceae bacterium]
MRLFIVSTIVLTSFLKATLVPMPREILPGEGKLIVDVRTAVIAPAQLESQAEALTTALQKTTGYPHRFRTVKQAGRLPYKRAIRLSLGKFKKPEFYRIEITPEGASIQGGDLPGLMHGIQTMAQLLPVAEKPLPRAVIPAQIIQDWPKTPRRVFHLDVSAHLFPTDELKSLIDWLSFHKLNELHLQLNGDCGWRMESSKFPKLHEIGSVRASTPPFGDPTGSDSTEYAGYYPHAKLKEIITHAESRAITVIPTFTFTTGATSLIASYPELGDSTLQVANTWEDRKVSVLQNDSTLKFIDELFAEVTELFPAEIIRIEGSSSKFHDSLEKIITKHGKRLLLSEKIKTTDFSVYPRPKEAELLLAAKLEAEEGFNPVHKVYQWKPGPLSQASLRTRYVHEFAKLQYLVFPRIAAFAEATWLPASSLDYREFRTRLDSLDRRYRLSKVYASFPYDPPATKALHDTTITTSIEARKGYNQTLVFDGKLDTFFWSGGGLKDGDYLTVEFPWPATGKINVSTGKHGTDVGILESGILELSKDGKAWDPPVKLFEGAATVRLPGGTRFVRIRATAAQDESLIFGELQITPILLAPVHEEVRKIDLRFNKTKIDLTFKADFSKNPEFRDEIGTAREIFFTNWLPLAKRIGTVHYPDVPRTFEIKSGEPGNLTDAEVKTWVLKRLIPQLQSYPPSCPDWIATGIRARLSEEIAEDPEKRKFKEGGSQTAAFFDWVAKNYREESLIAISQDCRNGNYHDSRWKVYTKKSLSELATLYQAAQ